VLIAKRALWRRPATGSIDAAENRHGVVATNLAYDVTNTMINGGIEPMPHGPGAIIDTSAEGRFDRFQLGAIIAFTLLYLIVGLNASLTGGNWEFVVYITVVAGLGLLVLAIRRRAGFTYGLLWALSIWGLLHVIGGLVPVPHDWPIAGTKRVFYSWWIIPGLLKYDNPVHAYGMGVATWACWQGLRTATGLRTPTAGTLAIAALAGIGLGALNEVVEFIATLFLDTNVGGYRNTGFDLIYNTVGAVIAAYVIRALGSGMEKEVASPH
jgi:hypothetical protein